MWWWDRHAAVVVVVIIVPPHTKWPYLNQILINIKNEYPAAFHSKIYIVCCLSDTRIPVLVSTRTLYVSTHTHTQYKIIYKQWIDVCVIFGPHLKIFIPTGVVVWWWTVRIRRVHVKVRRVRGRFDGWQYGRQQSSIAQTFPVETIKPPKMNNLLMNERERNASDIYLCFWISLMPPRW